MQSSLACRRRDLPTSILSATTLLAMSAVAQEPGSNTASDRAIEVIVVTAQKREQNLQDVPIVVTAIPEQLLEDTGVRDIRDLQVLTPGLTVTSTSNESVTTARIRGIGTVGDNPGLESSVGVVIDGVYRPRNGVGFGDLGELQRVEVLKGPQGTLFGKNTSAGVINIVTQRPSFEAASEVELSGGDFDDIEAEASITGPLVRDVLAGRLFAARRERDGFYDVSTGPGPRTLREDQTRNYYTVRGQLLFQPGEQLDLLVIGDYTQRNEDCCAAVQTSVGPGSPIIDALSPDAGLANPPDPFARLAFANRDTTQDVLDRGVSAELNWDLAALGGATLTSITAYRDWQTVNGQDADYTTADILYRLPNGNFSNGFEQASEELRLGGTAGPVNWLVGAFYANEQLDSNLQLFLGDQFQSYYSLLFSAGAVPGLIGALTGLGSAAYPGGSSSFDQHRQESDTWALFTNNTWAITEPLELTLGLRYTREEKDLTSSYFNSHAGAGCAAARANRPIIAGVLPATTLAGFYNFGCATFVDPAFNDVRLSQQLDEDEWSGTAKLAYRFTDNVMSYLSYARGYKAGGFNLDRERLSGALGSADPATSIDPDTSFPAEMADSYELGTKTEWLADSLIVNAAAFYQQFSDFQLNTFTGITFVVASVPEVVSYGIDTDVLWNTPWEGLTLQGGLTYARTRIEEFGATTPFFSPTRKSNQLSFAPEWSTNVSATYEQPLGTDLLLRFNVGAKYTSEYNTGSDLAPGKVQEPLTLVNARIGLGNVERRWMLEAWAQNLTDEDYFQVVFDAPLQPGTRNAFLASPRMYGLTARFNF